MLSAESFFAAAKAAGMLKSVSWTPSGGGAEQTADVCFTQPARDVLSGEAFTVDPTISYPASQLVGLVRGETVIVFTKLITDGVAYKVREDPRSELDGSRVSAPLAKV